MSKEMSEKAKKAKEMEVAVGWLRFSGDEKHRYKRYSGKTCTIGKIKELAERFGLSDDDELPITAFVFPEEEEKDTPTLKLLANDPEEIAERQRQYKEKKSKSKAKKKASRKKTRNNEDDDDDNIFRD